MNATYDHLRRFATEEDVSPDQADLPFSGIVNGVLIGICLWGLIGWAVWALVA